MALGTRDCYCLWGRQSRYQQAHKNILDEGELSKLSVVSKLETTATDGKNYKVAYYNLKMIIAIGYRLRNSTQATRFRIWATETLNEYLVKGFSIDTQRLKNLNQPFDTDYFDELLEKIRDIRLLKEKLEKLQIQKQGLMQNLLIGKVRVK